MLRVRAPLQLPLGKFEQLSAWGWNEKPVACSASMAFKFCNGVSDGTCDPNRLAKWWCFGFPGGSLGDLNLRVRLSTDRGQTPQSVHTPRDLGRGDWPLGPLRYQMAMGADNPHVPSHHSKKCNLFCLRVQTHKYANGS